LTSPIGWVGVIVVLALVPTLRSVKSGFGAGVLWAVAATIPGLFIVVMGRAIIVVSRSMY
jgi:hypothetical protein